MRKATLVLTTVAAFFLCFEAHATKLTVEQFRHPKDGDDHLTHLLYLSGVNAGLLAYNVAVQSSNKGPLFCQPGKLALTPDQVADILRRWAEKQGKSGDKLPVELALLYALVETFPCPDH